MNSEIVYKKGISISGIILLIIGIVTVYSETFFTESQSSIRMALMFFGAIIFMAGLVKVLMGKKYIVHKESGSRVTNYNLFFDSNVINRLQNILDGKQFDSIPKLKPADGNKAGVKLDLFISDDKKFAAAQVFQFIPFKYEPAGEQKTFYDNDAQLLANYIPNQK